ncbi:MAG: hypothetical protein ACREQP_20970, partial [Candidatus Binatia bacterium]
AKIMITKKQARYAPQCPQCGSEKVVRILYGLPTEAARDLSNKGKVALGGCLVDDRNPRWHCSDCDHDWR